MENRYWCLGLYFQRNDIVETDGFGNPRKSPNDGAYIILDVPIYRFLNNSNRGLNIFARFGIANNHVNRFGQSAGYGIVFNAPFESSQMI